MWLASASLRYCWQSTCHRPAHAKMLTNAVRQAASGNVGLPDRPFRIPKQSVWDGGTVCFVLRNGWCDKPLAHR